MSSPSSRPTGYPASPRAVVETFLFACSALDFDQALTLIDDDCVYQNLPFHTALGKPRIERDLRGLARMLNEFDVQMVNIAVNGNTVMTERVDTLGGRFFNTAIPVMGVFAVEGGKITQWRDYFDWSAAFGKMGGSAMTRWFRR